MANRWGNTGNSDIFIFLGSKITADVDYSHEIKRHLLLGRKVMTNLDSIFKSRDITLPTKVHLVNAMVFPVVMYGYESWTIKKAEHEREVAQVCLTLRDPMDCSLPGSSVQGIFQARVLEWVATAFTYSFSYLEPVCHSMSCFNGCFLACIQISQEAG